MPEDIFIRLVEAVEEQGGELLPRTHYGEAITYLTDENGRKKRSEAQTAGCGLESVLAVPYDCYEIDKDGQEQGLPTLKNAVVCAVDDAVHLWPRFAGVIE